MQYIFKDEKIMRCRQERHSNKLSRHLAAKKQAKREELEELCSVEELLAMGFYESSSKPLPYGVEIWNRNCVLSDENGWAYEREVPTLGLCLPKMERLQSVEKLNPNYWESNKTYYWGFKQSGGSVIMYCLVDLLNRLLDLPHWQDVESVPLVWKVGNEKALAFAKQQIAHINNGVFTLEAPRIKASCLHLSFNEIRHNYTPYDYEWQTGKRDRDEARDYWNLKIKNLKSN